MFRQFSAFQNEAGAESRIRVTVDAVVGREAGTIPFKPWIVLRLIIIAPIRHPAIIVCFYNFFELPISKFIGC